MTERKKTKFMLLSVPSGIWKALDAELLERRGPKGRLEIQEVAIELIAEQLNELSDGELFQFMKLHSLATKVKREVGE